MVVQVWAYILCSPRRDDADGSWEYDGSDITPWRGHAQSAKDNHSAEWGSRKKKGRGAARDRTTYPSLSQFFESGMSGLAALLAALFLCEATPTQPGWGSQYYLALVSKGLFVCLFVHGLRKPQQRRLTKGLSCATRGSRPQGQVPRVSTEVQRRYSR